MNHLSVAAAVDDDDDAYCERYDERTASQPCAAESKLNSVLFRAVAVVDLIQQMTSIVPPLNGVTAAVDDGWIDLN